MTVAVLFGSHAGNSFEIAVKGCWLGEAEQVGRFLKRLRSTCRNESLGLCYYILFYPFGRRETIGSHTNDFAEMLGCKVQQIGVELDLPRLPIVPYHQLAEMVEDLHMPSCLPLLVLFVTIVIEEFIANGQLCQQCLIAVGHFGRPLLNPQHRTLESLSNLQLYSLDVFLKSHRDAFIELFAEASRWLYTLLYMYCPRLAKQFCQFVWKSRKVFVSLPNEI